MKNAITTSILSASMIVLISAMSCESDNRTTGNETAGHENVVNGNGAIQEDSSTYSDRPDTVVTGVPGNTNAVNAAGNAGNGSGMGSSSTTGAKKNTEPNK